LVGFIDYMKINERRAVAIDMDLRKTFFRVLNEINKIEKGEIPKVKTHLKKCENCEYRELCEKNT
ncbi:MAG: Dna2/Cas4 domain-containing protein, partial [Methanobrevibacter sp.]|nr:Dna2/Cas4 domain-containing protein [Methanobrevibacter sp.]